MADIIQRCYTQRQTIQIKMVYPFKTINAVKDLAITCVFVRPDMVLVHTEDITESARAQEVLRNERNLMRTVIDNLPDYIFAKDRAGRFILGNKAHNRASNVSDEQIIGKTALEVFPRDLAERFTLDDVATMEQGESLINAERQTLDAFGNRRWVLTTKVPLHNADGQIIGLVGISRDITYRKQIEEKLETERTLLRTVIDTLPDYVHVKNIQSQFVIGNIACALSLGVATPEALVGKTDFDFHSPDMAAEFYADEQSLMKLAEPLLNKEEVVIDLRTGMQQWLLTTKVPLFDRSGQVTGLVGINRDITGRKQEEKTRMLLASIVESTDDAIIGMTVDGAILSWNKGAEKVYGYAPDEMIGQHVSILTYTGHLTDLTDSLAQIQHREYVHQFETVHARKDGCAIDVILTISPLDDSRGNLIGISTISRDISIRKQTERELSQYHDKLEALIAQRTVELTTANQQLRQGQEQLVRITDNMQDIICQIDVDGTIQYISPSCAKLLGCSAIVLHGSSIYAGVHPDDLDQMKAHIQRGEWATYRYRHANDHYIWLETLSTLLGEPNTKIQGIILTIRDISERKQTEQALQQSEERFRQLAENIDDVFWMSSPDYKNYIYVSPAYQKIWGRASESLYQQATSILDAIYPDDFERVVKAMGQSPRDDYDEQYRIVKPDGTLRWIHTRAFPIHNEVGEIYRLAGISSDITDQKLLEQELQDNNQLKTEFLSTAAHELRTPLASLIGFSEILLTREVTADRRQRFIKIIHEQSIQLKEIIDTLLDISRLESKQAMALDLQPIIIADVVTKTQSYFAEYLSEYKFEVEGLASCPPIMGDALRVDQLLQNLVSNAIKYSPGGGTITIRGQVIAGFIQLSIQDHGIGMTGPQQSHLFERFYRADASNTTISGTGLGLAFCKLIVELHGGRIWIESESMVGTTVHFTLPLSTLSLPAM